MPKSNTMKETLLCATYIAARVKFTKPDKIRLRDHADRLLLVGVNLWRKGMRNEQQRFATSMAELEVTERMRTDVLKTYQESGGENLAQFVSHLFLLALDKEKNDATTTN